MIYLASDHAGFELKEKIKEYLTSLGSLYKFKDFGAFKYDKDDDYPDFVIPAVRALEEDLRHRIESRAIIFGYSGQGEAMCANRFFGARAVVFYGGDIKIIKLSREHNNSNVLSFGAGFISEKEAIQAVKIWLETLFPGVNDPNPARHIRRIEKFKNV